MRKQFEDLDPTAQALIRTEAKSRVIESIGHHFHTDDVENMVRTVMRDSDWLAERSINVLYGDAALSAFEQSAIAHFAKQSLAAEMHEDPKGLSEAEQQDYINAVAHEVSKNPQAVRTAVEDYKRHLDDSLGLGSKPGGRALGGRGDVEADKGAA